jgi:hypothetical protein
MGCYVPVFWLNGLLLSLKASVFTIATLLVHKYLATLSICWFSTALLSFSSLPFLVLLKINKY